MFKKNSNEPQISVWNTENDNNNKTTYVKNWVSFVCKFVCFFFFSSFLVSSFLPQNVCAFLFHRLVAFAHHNHFQSFYQWAVTRYSMVKREIINKQLLKKIDLLDTGNALTVWGKLCVCICALVATNEAIYFVFQPLNNLSCNTVNKNFYKHY